MAEESDAVIIGAGQSGPFLAVRLAEQGQKVALIEREHLGGTSVNDGWTSVWNSGRGTHLGQRSCGSATTQAGHMNASDPDQTMPKSSRETGAVL
jgi:glycine/D-amino acid oxidase-like deaminating enzyme